MRKANSSDEMRASSLRVLLALFAMNPVHLLQQVQLAPLRRPGQIMVVQVMDDLLGIDFLLLMCVPW